MDLAEIGRISSKHARVTVVSGKDPGTGQPATGRRPSETSVAMNNTMNNHVHKQESADNEKQPIIDNVEAMDTTEGIITDINNLYHHVININYPNWITGLAAESSTIHKP